MSPQLNRLFTKIPLRLVLIVPFAIQVLFVTLVVGYLSFQNGRQAINNVAGHLRSEIASRIEEHLQTFLATPHQINQINANAIRHGWPDAHNPDALARYLWEQTQVFDSVTSIYFGNTAGGLVDAGREGAYGTLYIIVTDGFESGPFRKYALDNEGNRTNLITTVPDFDARTRSWYTNAVATGHAVWSDLYILFTGQDMTIAASSPVYDDQQNLLGVVSTDIFTSHISDFLKNLDIGGSGTSFIMERSGLLVASSTEEQPFTAPEGTTPQRRLDARESAIPTVHAAADFLIRQFGDYHNITGEEQLEFEIEGQRQLLQVVPMQDRYGIDWLVVVIIPESQFMAQINANNRTTAFLIGMALILAIAIGIITSRAVTKPILRINASTRALAAGDWQQTLAAEPIGEIDELAQSFNHMARQLHQTMVSLMAEIAERRQIEGILRESEEKYRSLIEQSSDAIYLLYENRFEVINRRFTELFGISAEEARAPDFNFMSLVAPQSREFIAERINKQAQGEEPSPYYEFTAQDKAGHEIEVEVSVSYISYQQGTAAQGILRDITERVRAEELLRQSKRRLEETLVELRETQDQMIHQERLAAIGQLAAGIAHDFNNILATIMLYAEMSLEKSVLDSAMYKRLEVIATQTEQGATLVQQILDFGRQSMLTRRPLAVDPLLQEVAKLLTRTLPENIQLDLSIDPGEYMIDADPTRVQQAVVNLALNARDAMPEGGEIHIALSRVEDAQIHCIDCGLVAGEDWVRVEVRDNGRGIPSDVLAHIFEPFFTTRAPLGHGLGLAQVYGIMKQHEGHIEVDTEIGEGTTFRLYWPVSLMAHQEEEKPSLQPDEAQGEGATVLVVEDNAVLRMALVDGLGLWGYHVLEASDGREALAVCEKYKGKIALVLSDWVMPSMNGLEMARQLEKQAWTPKVLVLTGHPLGEETKEAVPRNVVGWVLKPPNLKQLAEAVSNALR